MVVKLEYIDFINGIIKRKCEGIKGMWEEI